MNVAIFCAGPSLANIFIDQYYEGLAQSKIYIKVIVHDQNESKKKSFLKHSIKIASRQAKIAQCSLLSAFLRRAMWKIFIDKTDRNNSEFKNRFDIDIKKVGSLNAEDAIKAAKENHCDIICLMGARILLKRTLEKLGIPVINIHSSNPQIVRGGPSVFWEIYKNFHEITLTIHKITEVLDGGPILLQQDCPIVYQKTLASTIKSTLLKSQNIVAKMFRDVLIDYQNGTLREVNYIPGQLFVTPGIVQMVRAQFICMRNYRHINSEK